VIELISATRDGNHFSFYVSKHQNPYYAARPGDISALPASLMMLSEQQGFWNVWGRAAAITYNT
jgi:hypothetical protein